MQYESILLTTIEVAAVFYGFIIVFLTFVMGGQGHGKADRMHSRALLITAFPLIILPFIPLVIHAYGGSEALAWRAFHIGGFLGISIVAFVMTSFYFKLSRAEIKEVGYLHSITSYSLGAMEAGFCAVGAFGYAPAGNALAAILCFFVVTATAIFSFAAQHMSLFDWRNP